MRPPLGMLAFAVGLFVLAAAAGRAAAARAKALANPRFTAMAFAELPSWVRDRLSGLRDQFIALGFTELTNYTRNSPRLNYTCIFVSPDGLTMANAWVARSRGVMLWFIAPALGWSAFKKDLLGLARFGLITHFPDGRMVETSPVELLRRSHEPGVMEFVIVPPTTPLPEMRQRHETAIQDFAGRCGARPLSMTSAEQFFESERALIARVSEKLRRKMS